MMTVYLVVLLAVVLWKGYYAWQRGMNTYSKDFHDHVSLYEYLLGNGATQWQARRPFLPHALRRALLPLKSQWRLWLVLLLLGVIVSVFS